MEKNGKRTDFESHKIFVLSAVDLHEQRLMAYATKMLAGDRDRARDIVQHVFMKLCQEEPESIRHKLAPWLFTVCRNRALDVLRSSQKLTATDPKEFDEVDREAMDPAAQFERSEFLNFLQRHIDRLRPVEREVVQLWSHGLPHKQVAQVLSIPEGTVRVHLHRAIKQLKQKPQVAMWLERATGPNAKPDDDAETQTPSKGNLQSKVTCSGKVK